MVSATDLLLLKVEVEHESVLAEADVQDVNGILNLALACFRAARMPVTAALRAKRGGRSPCKSWRCRTFVVQRPKGQRLPFSR